MALSPAHARKRRLLLAGLALWGLSAVLVLADPGIVDRPEDPMLLFVFAPAGLGTLFIIAASVMDFGGQLREVGQGARAAAAEGATPLTRALLGLGVLLVLGGVLVVGLFVQGNVRGLMREGLGGEDGQAVLALLGVIGLGLVLVAAGYALERRRGPIA